MDSISIVVQRGQIPILFSIYTLTKEDTTAPHALIALGYKGSTLKFNRTLNYQIFLGGTNFFFKLHVFNYINL